MTEAEWDFGAMRADDLRKLANWLETQDEADGWAEAVRTAAEDLEHALDVGWRVHDLQEALKFYAHCFSLPIALAPIARDRGQRARAVLARAGDPGAGRTPLSESPETGEES